MGNPMKLLLAFFLISAMSFALFLEAPEITYSGDTDDTDQTDGSCHVEVTITGGDVSEDGVEIIWDGVSMPFDECILTEDTGPLVCTIDIPASDGEHTYEACATNTFGLRACTEEETMGIYLS